MHARPSDGNLRAAKRTVRASVVAAALGLVGLSSPAYAEETPDALALQALHNFAVCAVQQTPAGAEALLAMDPNSDEHRKAVKRFAKGHSRCITPRQELKFTGLPFAGALAEALIAARYEKSALAAKAAGAPTTEAKNLIEAIGRCVAQENSAAVERVLATDPGTPEETAALQLTTSTLPSCTPAGQTMTFNKPAVRAMYALGAYSLLAQAAKG